MKKLIKVIFIILLFIALVGALLFYGMSAGVSNLTIVNQKLTSAKLDESQSNLKIAFISDIHYNHFMNKERLEYMIQKINENKPDIIIFGGDLFDDPSIYEVSEEVRNELIELLKLLNADYGKFAVLGEEDHDTKDVESILFEADFELLNNEAILITKEGSKPMNLIGIDSLISGEPDIELSFENVDTSIYTIVVTHAPDIVEQLPISNIDLILSGHSHGGQIALPLIGPIQKIQGAQTYSIGTYYINGTTLIVSNGLGTTKQDFRLFSEPQCHMLRFEPAQD